MTYCFKILTPRKGNCLFVEGPMVFTKDFPINEREFYESTSISKLGDRTGKKISQTISENYNGLTKETIIKSYGKPIYKTFRQ